ncbi:MAG: type transport system ATP-binding protein, partial [Actinomycetota bacterium]|nr:type transport system ATP-binding protein [Actinomycetota bacterium]
NGSGKSTLLKCIGGILRPNKGQVRTAGRAVALIDLLAGFHRELTGRENLSVVAAMNGMSRKELALRYSDIVDFAELSEKVMDSPLLTYSAGMTLRLGFSVVIHADPAVLLVDEVLAVGDEAFRLKCLHRISELLGRGSAGVMVSHDLNLVPETCDRVMVLHEGRNVFLGPVGEAIDFYLELTKAFPEDDLSGSGPTEGVGLS